MNFFIIAVSVERAVMYANLSGSYRQCLMIMLFQSLHDYLFQNFAYEVKVGYWAVVL